MFAKDLFLRSKPLTCGCTARLISNISARPPAASHGPHAAPSVPPAATTARPPAATVREHVDTAKHENRTKIESESESQVNRNRPLPGPAYAHSRQPPAVSSDEEDWVARPFGEVTPGERLPLDSEHLVYSTDRIANGLERDAYRTKLESALNAQKFREKKRRDAKQVQDQVQNTRDRDLETMRKTGVIEGDQPEKEIDNHKRRE